jgi:hypothetical protein
MRQGDLSECPEEWTIRLARFFVTILVDARCSGDKLHLGEVVSQHTKQDLGTEVVRQTLESLLEVHRWQIQRMGQSGTREP